MAKNSESSSGFVIGIDAANLRQGGGITHLVELLRAAKPQEYGITKILVWGNACTLSAIENRPWLVKVNSPALDQGLLKRVYWQYFKLTGTARTMGCDLLFVPGGSYMGDFKPVVTMCRNMLPFEWSELRRYGWSLKTLRLLILRHLQTSSFHKASGIIFLTQYARKSVLRITGALQGKTPIISHGISTLFQIEPKPQRAISDFCFDKPLRIIYVSIINEYKHQWHVVEAVAALRLAGFPLVLELIGPIYQPVLARLETSLKRWDPQRIWVIYSGEIPYEEMYLRYKQADIGIFASSCENMPNILLETMATGLPVACSNRGPMPEVLGTAGVYFDPEKPLEIERALRELIVSPQLRANLAKASFERSHQYSWQRCADETFTFLEKILHKCKSDGGGGE